MGIIYSDMATKLITGERLWNAINKLETGNWYGHFDAYAEQFNTIEYEVDKLIKSPDKNSVAQIINWANDKKRKRTPLYLACEINPGYMRQFEIIELLLRVPGIDINKYGYYNDNDINKKYLRIQELINEPVPGQTPLWIASSEGFTETVKILLANNANVNLYNYKVRTPLWIAAKNNHLEVIKLLLSKGANVNIADINGKTPIDVASDEGRKLIEKRKKIVKDIENPQTIQITSKVEPNPETKAPAAGKKTWSEWAREKMGLKERPAQIKTKQQEIVRSRPVNKVPFIDRIDPWVEPVLGPAANLLAMRWIREENEKREREEKKRYAADKEIERLARLKDWEDEEENTNKGGALKMKKTTRKSRRKNKTTLKNSGSR